MHREPEDEYIANEGNCCPFCGSEEIYETTPKRINLVFMLAQTCEMCDHTWFTTYDITSMYYQIDKETK